MEEFCRTVKPSLDGYEADGVSEYQQKCSIGANALRKAWPTLLDDFVSWKKAKMETLS